MVSKIYTAEKAISFLPDTIKINNASVITPVIDNTITSDELGHLVVIPGQQCVLENDVIVKSVPLSSGAYLGSFAFIGTNPDYFNHLFKRIITGKYTPENIIIDSKCQLASHEMNIVIKYNLLNNIWRIDV